MPHWSASALLIPSACAALFAQVAEHVGRAFKPPDCRWKVRFESSTPARPPHIPAIPIVSRARCACVRLTYLHSCASAGRFAFLVYIGHAHGRCLESGGAIWAELMLWAAGAALGGFVQARRGAYGCARAAQTSWECCALGVRLGVSPRDCVVLGSLEARSGWEAYACDRMWACWARAGRAARFRGRVPRVSARKGRDGSRHHCCATFGRVNIRGCARSELGSTYELEHGCGLCVHLSTHTR